jgi:hypothetical protein
MSDTNNQQLTDARMEYGHLLTSYLSLVNMFWVGYGAFFTINTLLATGLFFSYSEGAKSLDKGFLAIIHILLPMTGVFVAVVAIWVARAITSYQGKINERGRELETLLFAKIFTGSQSHSKRFPMWSTVGSLFFLALWAAALYPAISCS